MPLRLAFDMDGVFADMDGELIRQAETLFGPGSSRRDPALAPDVDDGTGNDPADAVVPMLKLHLSSRQQQRLWQHVESLHNFWETLQEIEPGSIARLAGLAHSRGWEIIFLTKRPGSAGATAQVQTQRWLQSKGFPHPSVFVVRGSRGRIALALGLDFVIDDRPENCLDVVVDSQARAILVWRDDERRLPAAARRLGIGVVKTVGQCLDILAQVDAPTSDKPTVIDRVLRRLGLKDGTAT